MQSFTLDRDGNVKGQKTARSFSETYWISFTSKGEKTKLDIDLDAERWKAERKCLLDKKQGPLMDECHIG